MAPTVTTTEQGKLVDASTRGLIYYLWPTEQFKKEKPYISSVPFTVTHAPANNFKENGIWLDIRDIRSSENSLTLDRNAFQYTQHNFQHKPTGKITGPKRPYIEEVIGLLKELLQPKEVIVYDCNVCSLIAHLYEAKLIWMKVRQICDLNYFQPATSAHIGMMQSSIEN